MTRFGNNIVINLSNKDLSIRELPILNKGLTFIPTPNKNIAINSLKICLERFFKKMTTTYYFHNNTNETKDPLYTRTNWQPPHIKNPKLLNYFQLTSIELDKFVTTIKNSPIKNNFTLPDKISLQELKSRKDIVIKKADKGSAIVIMNTPDYLDKVYTHLNNEKAYKN